MKLSNTTLISLLLIFFTTFIQADTTWTTGAYDNNVYIKKTLSIPNAKKLIVSVKGSVENGYDFIELYSNIKNHVLRAWSEFKGSTV